MRQTFVPLSITASTLVSAAGNSKKDLLEYIQKNQSALRDIGYPELDFQTYLGMVNGVENIQLEENLQQFHCRNNQLVKLALDSDNFRDKANTCINKYGKDRVGLFVGSSTSGVAETEKAYQNWHRTKKFTYFDMLNTHNPSSAQRYASRSLGLSGVGISISTACSSSAKVFSSAYRYILSGLCDAAIVGGVDSLCLTTLYGFNSLQLVSSQICRPWDKHREGINIGEAAGFVILEKTTNNHCAQFKGYGESLDAYHMSTPHPEGYGAKIAINMALNQAKIKAQDIDYINLHGTGTRINDKTEAQALSDLFNNDITCSSTKGLLGHTLGAAGITDAIISILALENGIVPGNVNLKTVDSNLPIGVLKSSQNKSLNYVMSNSFGFGGSNCSLIFSC